MVIQLPGPELVDRANTNNGVCFISGGFHRGAKSTRINSDLPGLLVLFMLCASVLQLIIKICGTTLVNTLYNLSYLAFSWAE